MNSSSKLIFGMYPGGVAGGDAGLLSGPADDPVKVKACMDELQGPAQMFVVRCYDSFQDPDSPFGATAHAPANYVQYADGARRPLDLVLQFRSASGNVDGYCEFVRAKLREHGPLLYAVQITEEPNFVDGPNVIDGPYPNILRALTEGVVTAKRTLREMGLEHVKVGFNATPTFGAAAEFWKRLGESETAGWTESLDYVGLDFFPDVFRPAAADGEPGDVGSSVVYVLETMRREWMPAAGISERVAIDICESGWPTGPSRSVERQAEVIECVVRTVNEVRERLNVERYTLFSLRDVKGVTAENAANMFLFFGICEADYSRKAGFESYRRVIAELGTGKRKD